ncbi:MAG: LysM peptidoglycan-binding domain-containing protein [Gammaproteobacteria bacterium]
MLISFSVMVQAADVQVKPNHPDSYVVKKGDTLWDISARFLTEPWRWPEIWHVNPQIKNPHLIYPGDVVSLVYVSGVPQLKVTRGQPEQAVSVVRGRNVKLEPRVRYSKEKRPIPTIPIEAIREFLTRPLVVSKNELNRRPYIVSSYDQHLVAGSGDEIYVRGLPADTKQREFSIYRKGPAYKSHGKILGYQAIYVGEARVKKLGDPATAVVSTADREVLNGDRLIPQSQKEIRGDFFPRPPDHPVSGSIISAVDVISEIGQYQVVVLDLGANDGVKVGNVLGVYRKGAVITDHVKYTGNNQHIAGEGTNPLSNLVSSLVRTKQDFDNSALVGYLGRPQAAGEKVKLPDKYTGVLMVFRTFDKVSYALVMEATAAMHLNDTVKNL